MPTNDEEILRQLERIASNTSYTTPVDTTEIEEKLGDIRDQLGTITELLRDIREVVSERT